LAAFSSAPYPGVGWTPYIALILACTRRDSPFHLLPARPQPFGIMAFAQGAVSFLCQSQSSRPTPKEGVCVSRGGGTFHTGEGFASGSRPSTLAPGPHKGGYYKSLCERAMEIEAGRSQKIPPGVLQGTGPFSEDTTFEPWSEPRLGRSRSIRSRERPRLRA